MVLETVKNKSVDYEYNELNQLVRKTTSTNDTYTYSYDKRGNRIAETGKKASQSFVYDATNRLVEGTNWKGDTSAYTYNGLGLRVNNLVTTHAGQTYDRDYVIDYTSPENDDLYVYAMGNGQLEYEQRHVYAGSERIEQITERGTGSWERTLYVHEDVMGNTRYYTKTTGQSFAELQYDAWGQPVSPNKLVNNDHGNYVFATFTGHIYDTTLDIYFAEARFYDATNRTWLAMDPIKDGLNWYQYCLSNPTTNWDPTGLATDYFPEYSGCDSYSIFGGQFTQTYVNGGENVIWSILGILNATQGFRETITVGSSGSSNGAYIAYFNQRLDNLLKSSGGIKIGGPDINISVNIGFENLGITGSIRDGNVTSYYSIVANISKLSVGYEFGTTVQMVDGITMTEYTNVSISGPQALAAVVTAIATINGINSVISMGQSGVSSPAY